MTSETGRFGSATTAEASNTLTTKGDWTAAFAPERWPALASLLLGYVVERRWFRGKARTRTGARIVDVLEGGRFSEAYRVVLLAITYDDGPSETYVLPLAFVPSGAERRGNAAPAPVAEIVIEGAATSPGSGSGSIVDALAIAAFATELFELLRQAGAMTGASGLLAGVPLAHLAEMKPGANVAPRLGVAEQSNSNVIYGDRFLMKIYRAIEEGPNPEHEIGLFLTKAGFDNAPPIAAALEYRRPSHEACTVGVLFELVANQGDAWKYTLDALRALFDRARSEAPPPPALATSLLDRATMPVPSELRRLAGPYLDQVRLLGRRTAELHIVLQDSADEAFGSEPFDMAHQAALFASASRLAAATWTLLQRAGEAKRANPRLVGALLEREAAVKNALAAVTSHAIAARRTRVHGDYHLGQVLFTGEDFVIIDFEGEPARPLAERRLKRSPLCDVAGMIRSFHYAAQSALREARLGYNDAALGRWADAWFDGAAAQFWGGYSERARGALFLPPDRQDVAALLRFFLLEKCIYEVAYELNNRPDWLEIPAHGLLALLEA